MIDPLNPYTQRRLNQQNALGKAGGPKGARNAMRHFNAGTLGSLFGPGQTALSGRKASPGGTTMIRKESSYGG